MWTIIAPFITWAAGIMVGAAWFRMRSQKWADTAFLRRRLNQYRQDIAAIKENHEVVATSLERYKIRCEVLDEMLESEAETLYLLTGKRADQKYQQNDRIRAKVDAKITEARVAEAVIHDVVAVEQGLEPVRWRALLDGADARHDH